MRAFVKRKSFERKLIQISIWQQCSYAMWYKKKWNKTRRANTQQESRQRRKWGEKAAWRKIRKTVPTNNTQTYIVVLVYTIGKTSLSRIIHTKLCVYIFIIYIYIYLYMFHFFCCCVLYYSFLFLFHSFFLLAMSLWHCYTIHQNVSLISIDII